MTDFLDRISKLSPKRLALLALEQHEQLEALQRRGREPVAVIGMACRFPGGANDPAAFWDLLRAGRDAIGEVPRERWDIDAYFDPDPDAPARMSVRQGGFLDDIGAFDAGFFGIAPREALTMDPQQRLLLEVAWQALEQAGLAPDKHAGSATGVFIGICNSDHFQRLLSRGPETIDAYLASGNAHSVAAGRIAYCLGLQGPALSIDTACSSSLVALHVACRSVRSGESRVALAGGVNVMCSPETTIALSKAHMLAPDGRCKTFAATADGFSRGEGCGVLVLKRLEDALADGNRVLAVIRGSAANQDGRSAGLTVPNGPSQEAVIRAALSDGGVQPREIDYVEAHGTGTTLGDPIEVRALSGALGAERTHADPLLIGSVKTNIGHLESAAGIAGVIKVILALEHEFLPPHLHFSAPNPHIAWSDYPVQVTAHGQPWPRGARRRLAGVSSFGFSGTNAHVVLEEAPIPAERPAGAARSAHCLPLSARSIDALARLAVAYDTLLDSQVDSALVDIAYAASVGRAHFDERLAVVADSPSTARKALQAFANGQEHPAVRRGTAVAGRMPEVVFLFTGQGSQYPGMARDLYESAPVFREVIDRCDGLLGADSQGRTLKSVLWALAGDDAPIHETAWTQPALFAVEYGIVQLWRAFGIEPAAVIGHSVGEYVAACIAGVFTLEDGLKLIAERGRLMGSLPPGGTMAALFAPAEEIAAAIAPVADRVAIAAINAPDSVVISGDAQEIDRLLETFAARNVRGHRLFISFAAHSPLVAPALDAMQACAAQVTMRVPRMPIAWNLTGGEPLPGGAPDAVYWRRHLREPVRFAAGMAGLHAQGYRTFLEVGPHPTLIALAQRSLPEGDTLWLNSLRRGKSDWPELLGSLASLYARGAAVNWAEVAKPSVGRPVTLPGYPFERRTFWLSPTTPGQRDASTRRVSGSRDSLQCEPLPAAVPIFESVLTPTTPAYLGEHRVHGAVLVAGPVLLELMQSAAAQAFGSAKRTIGEFTIRDPLVLPEAGRTVQIHFAPSGSGSEEEHAFSIYSRAVDGSGAWRQHATGKLTASADLPLAPPASLDALRAKLGQRTPGDPYYARLADLGIDLGAPFRTLRETYRGTDEALARVELAPSCRAGVVHWTHPTLLDGALQSVGLAVPDTAARDVCLLTGVERVSLRSPLPESLWCHARLRAPAAGQRNEWLADVTLLDDQGAHLGALSGVRLYLASRDALRRAVEGDGGAAERATPDTANLYYEVAWEPVPLAAPAAPLLVSPHTFASQVRERFADLAVEHRLRVYDDLLPALDRLSAEHVVVALLRLGFEARVGRRFTVASEAERLGVLPRHARLFARMLDMLVEDGLLRAATDYSSSALDSMLEVALAFPSPAPEQRYDELLARFGAVDGELLTLRRCAFELAGVLDGTRDPVALLFPGGSLTEARQLYVESPSARTYNGALAAALQAATAALPPNARLRVLEIGAGTGGTTTYLLPLLPADRVEYTFTDVSPLFLERAAEQFSQYPFVRRSLLDIERDPATQGFGAGHYDIVIAANVLHATSDLRRTVEHVRSLIAPGGLLLLLEGTAPERWVDLTFGLTEGWWRFTDRALRPAYPLVACDMWQSLLERLGFEDVAAVPSAEAPTSRATHQALIVARARTHARHWMLLADAGSTACTLADALAHRLRARGDTAIILPARAEPDAIQGNVDVVYLGATDLPVDESDPTDLVEECKVLACAAPLRWLAALGRQPAAGRVWLVTRGAQPIIDDFADAARWQAPLWGLGRVFALEQPSRWGGLIDLPPRGTVEEIAGKLLASLDAPDEEDQTGWRGEQRYAARLIPSPAPKAKPIALRTDAIYLITGGFGGLGLVVARWMVRHGARHLALLARNPDANSPAIRELKALGATIMALRADVADAASMAEAFERIAASGLPLRGVVHAAADFSTAPIDVLEASQVTSMLRPKLDGTVLLERLVASHPLDFLVLFSSSTAVLGATGFAHYAAANQFLDATAQCSRRRERPVLSINWGTWDTMRLASAESQASYRKSGLEPMPSNATLDALGRLLGTKASQAIVASIDWSVLKPLHEARRARPLLAQLGNGSASPIRAAPATVAQDTGVTLLDQLLRAAPVTQHEVLVAIVRQEVAKVLGVDSADDVPLDKGLFEMGMDSLMSVELKRRLERAYGRSLPATLTFNYPNVTALVAFLQRSLTAAGAVTTVSVPPVATMERDPAQAAPGQATPGLDALSEAELEARLLSTLEKMR